MSGGPGRDSPRSRGRSPAPLSRDPAFALLIACAAWPPTPAGDARILAAAHGIDWSAFVTIVDRHRMAGMAWAAIERVPLAPPAELRAALAERARRDTIQTLEVALLAERLCDRLAKAGIACGVFKGPPLAQIAYGTLAVRQTRDLDLWVDPARFGDALATLRTMGFHPAYDHMTRRDARMMWLLKDIELVDARGQVVELHTRLCDNPALLGGTPDLAPAPCGAGTVPALGGDALLLYLCVHGQVHAWERLKWLVDVSALFARHSPAERARFRDDAARAGLSVPVDLALHLCAIAWPERFGVAAGGQRVRWLARVSHGAMHRPLSPTMLRSLLHLGITSALMTFRPRYWAMLLLRFGIDVYTAQKLGGSYAMQALTVPFRIPLLVRRRLLPVRR